MMVELTPALQKELGHLAAERGLSVDDLAHYAIESFVLQERDLHAAVQRGEQDMAAGRLLQHDEVVSRINRLLAAQ
jgi:predicted transcriptional regulator